MYGWIHQNYYLLRKYLDRVGEQEIERFRFIKDSWFKSFFKEKKKIQNSIRIFIKGNIENLSRKKKALSTGILRKRRSQRKK